MTLPAFRLHRPARLAEAVGLLGEHGDGARILAGGTDLVVNLRHRLFTPEHLVHIGRLRELGRIEYCRRRGLRVGAMVTISDLAAHPTLRGAFPVLARAAASVSGPTLRRMGTVGGNLCLDTRCHWYNQSYFWREACGFCLKKDGDHCHVVPGTRICWAAYCGDLAPAFLALHAEVVLESFRGERVLPLERFFLDDGKRRLDLAPEEILTELRVPPQRAGYRGYYGKLRARGSVDFAVAGIALAARVSARGAIEEVAAALTAVGPRPVVVEGLQDLLEGRRSDDDEAVERASSLVRRVANPMRTGGFAPPGYRRHRLGLFVREGLRDVGRAGD